MIDYKFRGQDIETKEWYYGGIYQKGEDFYIVDGTNKYNLRAVVPETVGQYTRFNDKTNNKKAYEGDFIPYHFNNKVKGVVRYGQYKDWNDDEYSKHIGFYVDFSGWEEYIRNPRKDLGYWLSVSYIDRNVHNNPELLKDVK